MNEPQSYNLCGCCFYCCIALGGGDPEVIEFKNKVEQGLPVDVPQCKTDPSKPCQGTLELIEIYGE